MVSFPTSALYAVSSPSDMSPITVVLSAIFMMVFIGWGSRVYKVRREEAQHTALGRACAECTGEGEVGAKSDRLWVVCEKVLDPSTGGEGDL